MNSDTENRSQGKSLIRNLTEKNRELMNTIEKAEAPTAVKIPYERRQAEIELLKAASQFQPELYRLISQLATREDLADLINEIAQSEDDYLKKMTANYSKQCQEMINQLKALSEQDGKNRERFISDCTQALQTERDKLSEELESLRRRTSRILITVSIMATALSALVSYLLCRVLL